MNILFINETNCITNGIGGIVRVTRILSSYFTTLQHHCFLGFFKPQEGNPQYFQERILLSMPFNNSQFEEFLVRNQIQIIIATIWTHQHIKAMTNIYTIAHSLGIKVLYEVHVTPGHELVQFASFNHILFNLKHHQSIKIYGTKWLFSKLKYCVQPIVTKTLQKKYLIPYLNSDQIILLSQKLIPRYSQLIGITRVNKIKAIENTLTYNEFATPYTIDNKKKEVLMVGRLSDFEKRISLALKIWKIIEQDSRLADWTLTLIGDGDDKLYYEFLIKKLQLKRVSLVGIQEPLEFYRRASIIILTSAAEGWPMVLMEAAQMGVPAVVFDSFESLHEIIIDKRNGFIISDNNIKLFSEKLSDLMQDNTKRKQMALAAVEDSKRFSAEKILLKWEKLLQQCLIE